MATSDSPGEWYANLPPITKFWFTACGLTTLGYHASLVNPRSLMLSWSIVRARWEAWRVATNFFFLGKLSLGFAMRMVMIATYGVALERASFTGVDGTADFLTFLLFGVVALAPLELVAPSIAQAFYGDSLIFMCLYMWSRENPRARVSIMGVVRVGAFYFPWAMLAMTVLMGGDPVPDLLGIVVGHAYYFFSRLYPLRYGCRPIIRTPQFVRSIAAWVNSGSGVLNTASNAMQPPRTRYFQGQGRRLGD